MNPNPSERALIVLCAYDALVLHLTLQALDKTVDEQETVVIVLNGKRGVRSTLVETRAREWAQNRANRFVVRPLSAGGKAYDAVNEVLADFPPLQNKDFICKIDDDIITLKAGWLDRLHQTYLEHEAQHGQVGFTTPLINNNCWGFARLVEIYGKQSEYAQIMNHPSHSGTGITAAGEIADGFCGSVWEYPYLARWCHQWTLLDIPQFIEKTAHLGIQEIPLHTHYSIGCIFFRKNFWHEVGQQHPNADRFDELMIHEACLSRQAAKLALMNEPMGHLYYFIQRKPNADLLPLFAQALADFWQDTAFLNYPKYGLETQLMLQFEEMQGQ